MSWRFEIHFVPGHSIPAPDATSRNPQDNCDNKYIEEESDWADKSAALAAIRLVHEPDEMETGIVAAAKASLPSMQAVTWKRVRDETSRDG